MFSIASSIRAQVSDFYFIFLKTGRFFYINNDLKNQTVQEKYKEENKYHL